MGAEIEARDDTAWTPLDYAAKNGFYKSMRILLENDAPVDAKDKNNNTPLHWAAANGHVLCVSMLLDYGANISLKNIHGKNCLDLAVDNFHQETCMGLVTHARLVSSPCSSFQRNEFLCKYPRQRINILKCVPTLFSYLCSSLLCGYTIFFVYMFVRLYVRLYVCFCLYLFVCLFLEFFLPCLSIQESCLPKLQSWHPKCPLYSA